MQVNEYSLLLSIISLFEASATKDQQWYDIKILNGNF